MNTEAVGTLLAPGCKLDALTEVADPTMDLPVHEVGQVIEQILEHLGMVLVKRQSIEGRNYFYELVPRAEAAARYFTYHQDIRR